MTRISVVSPSSVSREVIASPEWRASQSLPQDTSKDPWLAATLSSIVPGLGHIYVGRPGLGCFLIIASVGLFVGWHYNSTTLDGHPTTAIVSLFALFVLWVWGQFNCHKSARLAKSFDPKYVHIPQKQLWLAVFLSRFVPALGQFYNRQPLWALLFAWVWGAAWVYWDSATYMIVLTPLVYGIAVYHAGAFSPAVSQRASGWLALVAILVFIQVLGLAFYQRYLMPFEGTVKTAAMMPIILPGDSIVAKRNIYGVYRRGDIVIGRMAGDPQRDFVLRVAAFEGESVEIKEGRVRVNGSILDGSPFSHNLYLAQGQYAYSGEPYKVPLNSLFLLGDNSRHSHDSRQFGSVSVKNIFGVVFRINWPPDRTGPINDYPHQN